MAARCTLFFLLLLVAAPLCPAESVLVAPAAPLAAGGEFEIVLLVTNPTNTPVPAPAPSDLPAVAIADGRAVSTVLRPVPSASADSTPLAPGSFRALRMRGRLPADLSGLIVLDATAVGAGRAVLEIAPAFAAGAAPSTTTAATVPSAAPLPSRRDLGISPHEPIYFSVGNNDGLNARFQLSFKFRPIGPSDDRVAGRGFWEDVYLGYTQTSLWDLHSLSKPFTDSSYRPAVFYHRHSTGGQFLGAHLGFAAGLEHESNGKGGDDSRSINTAFARPILRWGKPDGWRFSAAPKIYGYLEKSENDDLQRFRGYGDFLFALEHPHSLKLATTFRVGTSGRGSILVDASYPFSRINDLFPLGFVHGYLHLQFFDGWGESLLHYDERAETQFRFGFMAVR